MEHLPDLLRGSAGRSMTEVAYFTLKRQVIELTHAPGATLREKEIAGEMSISKTPVREALTRLHHEGLVQLVPRWGYIVSPVTLSDAANLCDMRTILQSESAALAAARGIDSQGTKRLQELCIDTDADDGLGGPGLDARLRDNYEFESLIANSSGNERLAGAVAQMLDEFERVVRLALRLDPSLPPGRLSERQKIVDAIGSRDVEASRSAMRERSLSAKEEVLDALRRSDSVGSVSIAVP